MQAQARFEPQGIAGAEPDRHHRVVGEQRLGQGLGGGFGHRNLEAVLPRVAGAGHEAGLSEDRDLRRVHEAHRRHLRGEPGEHALRLRALERDQRAVERSRRHRGREMGAQVPEVGRLVGGVDHQHEPVAEIGHHQVVADAAAGIGQEAVALPAGLQPANVGRDQGFQGAGGVGRIVRGERDLAHMRDVEQAGAGAGVTVLRQQAGGVMQRHVVAGKRHHPRAAAQVQGVQRRALRLGWDGAGGGPDGICVHLVVPRRRAAKERGRVPRMPPSVAVT